MLHGEQWVQDQFHVTRATGTALSQYNSLKLFQTLPPAHLPITSLRLQMFVFAMNATIVTSFIFI
jgi:hypothetical protein